MIVLGKESIEAFSKKHDQARSPLNRWLNVVEAAQWRNSMDMRQTFRSADPVPPESTVFNIGGNKYRLTAEVDYEVGLITITKIETHEEYSRKRG